MSTSSDRGNAAKIDPVPAAPGRLLGSLQAITDSERRALRPIGMTAYEVAARTGTLLRELLSLPSVRIFQAVHLAAGEMPCVPHVICAGNRLVFVESVAWPPGRYSAAESGRINCDGVYIGQSVRPLAGAVRRWQEMLPDDHWVSALVVVHPTAAGELALPGAASRQVGWAGACDAVRELRTRLPGDRQATSMTAVAALVAAAAEL